jgi:TonB family protein
MRIISHPSRCRPTRAIVPTHESTHRRLHLIALACAAALLSGACAAPAARPPNLITGVAPLYPPAALAAGIEGHVVVAYRVSRAGAAEDARVVESAPTGVFDDAAITAIRGWRFQPQRADTWVHSRIEFTRGEKDWLHEHEWAPDGGD